MLQKYTVIKCCTTTTLKLKYLKKPTWGSVVMPLNLILIYSNFNNNRIKLII